MIRRINFKLYMARIEKLWTVEEAAQAAQVDIQTYRRWEHGKQIPQISSLRFLCKAFGKTPAELGY